MTASRNIICFLPLKYMAIDNLRGLQNKIKKCFK